MSSTSGGGFRGRGRGSSTTPTTSTRGRGSSSRGRGPRGSASRGSYASRITFGQTSQQNAFSAPRGESPYQFNGARQLPTQRGASNTAKTRGSWQERYQALIKARERERAEAILHGQIADPDKPRSLSEALTPIGTCQDMCAEYERVQRVVQKDVWDEETNPNQSAFATTEKEPDESRMVKKFRRAAAGLEEQLPSDLRPPYILKQTCDYLFDEVIGNAPSLAHVHHFVWDRTRAIRNDFSIQQVTKTEELRLAIECYERIARFHILSLHQLALPEKPYSKYDGQQEREQLDRTLLSLMQYYDDSRGRIDHPNEAEFRAYCVIFQLQDPTPDLEDRVQTWPKTIIQDARVRKAVELYMAACNVMDAQGPLKPRANHLIARQDWQKFWTLVASKEVSYLMACTAEIYFTLVRRTVLNALFRTFRVSSTMATPDWTVDLLRDLLAFDDGDEVYTYCERFGFSFKEREDGEQYLDLTSVRGRTLPEPNAGMPKQMKTSLVENKRLGRTLPAVINGLNVKQAQEKGLVREDAEHDESMGDATGNGDLEFGFTNGGGNEDQAGYEDDENSLFIPETSTSNFPSAAANTVPPSDPSSGGKFLFNTDSSAVSSFGQPSNSSSQPSIFTQNQGQAQWSPSLGTKDNSKPLFNFTQPAAGTFGKPSTSASPFGFSGTTDKTTTDASDSISKPFSFSKPTTDISGVSQGTVHSSQSNTIFTTNSQSATKPPLFSFTPPAITGPNTDAAIDNSQPSKSPIAAADSRSPSPEQPKSTFTFEKSAATSALLPNSQSEAKSHAQPQPTSQSTSPTATAKSQFSAPSSSGTGVKRSSFSNDTRPKKPSPLSNSITAGDESGVANSEAPRTTLQPNSIETHPPSSFAKKSEATPQKTAAEQFDAVVTRFTNDLCNDPDVGIFQQFIEYEVGRIALHVFNKFTTERDNKEADDWRKFTLHQKYGRRWIDWFWQRRLAKTGRERRERRQRRLQQRGSQQRDEGSLYEADLAGGSSRGGSVFDTTLVNSIRRSAQGSPRSFMNDHRTETSSKPLSSSHGDRGPAASRGLGHKRMKSTSHVDERGRIAKPSIVPHSPGDALKRSAFLDFAVAKDGKDNNKDSTVSNYFRHKALGLNKIDQSTGVRGIKRRSESLQLSPETSPPALRSPLRQAWSPGAPTNKQLMKPPSSAPLRVAQTSEEDEALFARLRAARESLKLGMSPPDNELPPADALGRSASSQSSTDSPSMQKARIDARLRASQGGSASERSVPAYRLRESRFVPREHYGRAIERAKEIRESRSRETSRPESQAGRHTPDRTQQSMHAMQGSALREEFPVHDDAVQTHAFYDQEDRKEASDMIAKKVPTKTPPNPFEAFAAKPVSFSNHTTQLASANPFLQQTFAPLAVNGFAPQPAFDFATLEAPAHEAQDHTIQPSQIEHSLANSFGSPGGFGSNAFGPIAQHPMMAPQQNSYMHSQNISLLSDDEEEESEVPPTFDQQAYADEEEIAESAEELIDEASDDEEPHPDAHQSLFVEEDEDSNVETASEVDQVDNLDPYFRTQARDESDDGGSEEDVNGYIEHEDDDDPGVNGDIDEDETEVDEEEEASEEEDDEEGDFASQLGWQQSEYDDEWSGASQKNPALQEVGNSAEEAIELSD